MNIIFSRLSIIDRRENSLHSDTYSRVNRHNISPGENVAFPLENITDQTTRVDTNEESVTRAGEVIENLHATSPKPKNINEEQDGGNCSVGEQHDTTPTHTVVDSNQEIDNRTITGSPTSDPEIPSTPLQEVGDVLLIENPNTFPPVLADDLRTDELILELKSQDENIKEEQDAGKSSTDEQQDTSLMSTVIGSHEDHNIGSLAIALPEFSGAVLIEDPDVYPEPSAPPLDKSNEDIQMEQPQASNLSPVLQADALEDVAALVDVADTLVDVETNLGSSDTSNNCVATAILDQDLPKEN